MAGPIHPRHRQPYTLSERQQEATYVLAKYISRQIGDLKGRVTQSPDTNATEASKKIAQRIFKKEE